MSCVTTRTTRIRNKTAHRTRSILQRRGYWAIVSPRLSTDGVDELLLGDNCPSTRSRTYCSRTIVSKLCQQPVVSERHPQNAVSWSSFAKDNPPTVIVIGKHETRAYRPDHQPIVYLIGHTVSLLLPPGRMSWREETKKRVVKTVEQFPLHYIADLY